MGVRNQKSANAECISEQAELLAFHTPENVYILNDIKKDGIWSAITKKEKTVKSTWDDGTSIFATRLTWPSRDDKNKNCVIYDGTKLADEDCKVPHQFVCKYIDFTKSVCGEGWVGFRGNCYRFHSAAKNREEAKKICAKSSAFLTTVNTRAEMKFLDGLISDSIIYTGLSHQRVKHITWGPVGKDDFIHLKWDKNEPNAQQGCVVFTKSGMRAKGCTDNEHFVCQYRVKTCGPDWYAIGGSCFKIIDEVLSHDGASVACEENGALLASFEDEYELHTISPLLPNRYYWIGAQNIRNSWTWIDGTLPFSKKLRSSGLPGSYAVLDRLDNVFYEVNEWKNKSANEYLYLPAVCKKDAVFGYKRPCKDLMIPSEGGCYREIPADDILPTYQVEKKKCPVYPELEKKYFQQPKYVTYRKRDTWSYCLYDIKVTKGLFGYVNSKNEAYIEEGIRICLEKVHGQLLYPENENEFKFLHRILLQQNPKLPHRIAMRELAKLYLFSDINIAEDFEEKAANEGKQRKFIVNPHYKDKVCHPNWIWVAGSCYRFYKEQMNRTSAGAFCEAMKNTELANFPNYEAMKSAWSAYHERADSYWIGVTRQKDKWKWDDGRAFDTSNWEIKSKGIKEKCATQSRDDKYIEEKNCKEKFAFVCSYRSSFEVAETNLINRLVCKVYYNDTEYEAKIKGGINKEDRRKADSFEKTSCPLRWMKQDDDCFRLYPKISTWEEGQKRCEAQNSLLAVFKTKEQYTGVTNKIGKTPFWIGLERSSGKWRRVDRVSLPFETPIIKKTEAVYRKCAHGSPIQIPSQPLRSLNSKTCSELISYMCVFKPRERCELGFIEYKSNCYSFVNLSNTPKEAEEICHYKGSNIVWIESKDEQDFLNEMEKRMFWIGLTLKYNRLYWQNNTKVTFMNWAPGEEANCCGGESVYALNGPKGWVVSDKGSSGIIICKYKMKAERSLYYLFSSPVSRKGMILGRTDSTLIIIIVFVIGVFTIVMCVAGIIMVRIARKPIVFEPIYDQVTAGQDQPMFYDSLQDPSSSDPN